MKQNYMLLDQQANHNATTYFNIFHGSLDVEQIAFVWGLVRTILMWCHIVLSKLTTFFLTFVSGLTGLTLTLMPICSAKEQYAVRNRMAWKMLIGNWKCLLFAQSCWHALQFSATLVKVMHASPWQVSKNYTPTSRPVFILHNSTKETWQQLLVRGKNHGILWTLWMKNTCWME